MDPEIDLSTADRDAFIAIIASQQAIFERLEKRIDQLKRPLVLQSLLSG